MPVEVRAYREVMLRAQDVSLDPETHRVWRDGVEVLLSPKEFDLVLLLITNAGETVSRATLMAEVWGTTFWTSSKTIDVHLGWVRRKLGDDPRSPVLITTVRGKGLRFEGCVESAPPEGIPQSGATPLELSGP